MQIIRNNVNEPILALDQRARAALGAACSGISSGGSWLSINLTELATGNDIGTANDLLDGINNLSVTTDKGTITADDLDTATITAPSAVGLSYLVTLDGVPYASGTIASVGGVCTETLATDIPGTYVVTYWQSVSPYASGTAVIIAED